MTVDSATDLSLAVLSDIHGNVRALEAVLGDIKQRGVDSIINLGDCVTSPLWPRETYEMLQSLAMPTVRGNHDRWIGKLERGKLSPAGQFAHDALEALQRQQLAALPPRLELAGGILAVHGTPEDDSCYLLEEMVDGRLAPARRQVLADRLKHRGEAGVVLCGHSHNQGLRLGPGGCLILNPGSVGCPVFADSPAAPSLEYRSPHARYAILTRRTGRWSAEMHAIDYDWVSAARRALENGRPDWAEAISTGTVGS